MEIPEPDRAPGNARLYIVTKKRTLKDGTVKTYTYSEKYSARSNVINCNKTLIHKKITDCKDREKLTNILEILIEMGL